MWYDRHIKGKGNKKMKKTFKTFVKEIAAAPNREWAIQNIFYGADGVDMAFQREWITYADSELLLQLIENLKEN